MGFFATGHRPSPRSERPTHEWNHDSGRFANVSVLATWTLFDSEFWPNRFKRLGIRPNQSENFGLDADGYAGTSVVSCPARQHRSGGGFSLEGGRLCYPLGRHWGN